MGSKNKTSKQKTNSPWQHTIVTQHPGSQGDGGRRIVGGVVINLRSWSDPSSFLSSLLFMNGNRREKEKFFFLRSSVDTCPRKRERGKKGAQAAPGPRLVVCFLPTAIRVLRRATACVTGDIHLLPARWRYLFQVVVVVVRAGMPLELDAAVAGPLLALPAPLRRHDADAFLLVLADHAPRLPPFVVGRVRHVQYVAVPELEAARRQPVVPVRVVVEQGAAKGERLVACHTRPRRANS